MLNITKKIGTCIITSVYIASCQVIGPVSNAQLAQTLVSNPNYLDQCKSLNPIKLSEQISYKNVWPGKTKASEVESILGTPQEKSSFDGGTNLVYGKSEFFVSVENGLVTYIVVDPNPETNLSITLEEVILRHGCPDVILAFNTTEDQSGYNSVRLIYSTIGMEISFANYPTSLGSSALNTSYFPPMTVQEFFDTYSWTEMRFFTQPVEWSEAIK
ncbi:MAG TPA: hypothetical protein VFQ23_12270 [Anaerolineales bacterium]|nr:hypothetical protein [Anaerolineales bacterium]